MERCYTVKTLCKVGGLVAVSVFALLLSSCASGKVQECDAEKTQPQLVPQESAGKAAPAADVKKAETEKAAPATDVKKAETVKAAPAADVKKAETEKAAPAADVKKAETVKAAPVRKTSLRKAAVKLPCEHTVRTGENLWQISVRYYGRGVYWKQIQKANIKQIRKAEYLEPGMVLTIPALKKGKITFQRGIRRRKPFFRQICTEGRFVKGSDPPEKRVWDPVLWVPYP